MNISGDFTCSFHLFIATCCCFSVLLSICYNELTTEGLYLNEKKKTNKEAVITPEIILCSRLGRAAEHHTSPRRKEGNSCSSY